MEDRVQVFKRRGTLPQGDGFGPCAISVAETADGKVIFINPHHDNDGDPLTPEQTSWVEWNQ